MTNAPTNVANIAQQISLDRLPKVLATLPWNRAALYKRIRHGLFVRPVRCGPKLSAWPSNETQAIVAAHIAGKSEAEIAALVRELHQKRASN